jgi:transposase
MLRKSELCGLLGQRTGKWVSRTALCRYVQKLGVSRKKKTWYSSQAGTERVQKLRVEYWEKIRNIEIQNKRIFRRNRDDAGFG